jgi:hypothetical protein
MHDWVYIPDYQYPTDVGMTRGGDFWVCTKCKGLSSDIGFWSPGQKPPNDAKLNTWDGKHTVLSCDDLSVYRIHDS